MRGKKLSGRCIGMRRPDHRIPARRVGDTHPVKRALGRQLLKEHWTALDDAEEMARRECELEMLDELDRYCSYTIIW